MFLSLNQNTPELTASKSAKTSLLKDGSWIRKDEEEDEDVDRDPNFGKSILSRYKTSETTESSPTSTTWSPKSSSTTTVTEDGKTTTTRSGTFTERVFSDGKTSTKGTTYSSYSPTSTKVTTRTSSIGTEDKLYDTLLPRSMTDLSSSGSDNYSSYTRTYSSSSRPSSTSYEYSSITSPTVYTTSSTKYKDSRMVLEKELCSYCRKPFNTEAKMVLDDMKIRCHASCLKCEVCNHTLGHLKAGDSLWIYRRTVYCEKCFDVTRVSSSLLQSDSCTALEAATRETGRRRRSLTPAGSYNWGDWEEEIVRPLSLSPTRRRAPGFHLSPTSSMCFLLMEAGVLNPAVRRRRRRRRMLMAADAEQEVIKLQELVRKLEEQNQQLRRCAAGGPPRPQTSSSSCSSSSCCSSPAQSHPDPASYSAAEGHLFFYFQPSSVSAEAEEEVGDEQEAGGADADADAGGAATSTVLEEVEMLDLNAVLPVADADTWLYVSPRGRFQGEAVLSPLQWCRRVLDHPGPEVELAKLTLGHRLDQALPGLL
ncbi:hypothetical protein CRUP_026031 [Coryphaenoides rupestris]|nr:hypothetical protein CRUP_026031 [Coryphaenoides rupestris]